MKLVNMTNNLFSLLFVSILITIILNSHISSASLATLREINVITHFGAKNDGVIDATQQFLNAWNTACASSTPYQITIPKGTYLLKPLEFKGPCKSSVSYIIQGTLTTSDYNSNYWITFSHVDGLHVTGGVLDANGKNLWDCKASKRSCPDGATSLVFVESRNIIVDGLTSTNSQKFHIAFVHSKNINMNRITINADGNSPNTDGIHLQNSNGATIKNSKIMTGDDCISMGGPNQNVWIENIICGPGHGISIGSLGHKDDEGILVQNITVKSTRFTGTQNGVRIKTMSSPINGNVKDIYVLESRMNNAENPIIIDQNYCTEGNCDKGEGSGIQISNVVYENIHGTSGTKDLLTFDCSPKKPCTALKLHNIEIDYRSGAPNCINKNAKLSKGSRLPSNCKVVITTVA